MKKINPVKVLLSMLTGCLIILSWTSRACAQDNIALDKPVTFSAKPNYLYSTDPDDNKQLTDGKYVTEGKQDEAQGSNKLWVQKGAVGWHRITPVVTTIDLGSVQPISGALFSTAAGVAMVTFPTAIYMAVSNDKKIWHAAGNLVALSQVNDTPAKEGYATYRYVTRDLRTKGRYISFTVMATPFVFCDEIKVFKGEEAWGSQPAEGEVISDLKEYTNASLIRSKAQRRLYDDIDSINKEIDDSKIGAADKSTFNALLEKYNSQVAQMPKIGRDFKTILPLNDTHRNIFAIRGEALAAQGIAPLTIWKMHRYKWLPYLAQPNTNSKTQLSFSMLGNQFRLDNLLFTNASGKSKDVILRMEDAPQNAQNGWLQVYSVAWTDTSDGTPVANALIPVDAKDNEYTVEVPAGMTCKV